MNTIVFACVHNAGRSQMAAAFFNTLADPTLARAISGGTQPGNQVHPMVVRAMRDVGIDLSQSTPQRLTEELARDARMLITMGCGDECPYIPGADREDWPLPDPADADLPSVRTIRDAIRSRVLGLIREHHWERTTGISPV